MQTELAGLFETSHGILHDVLTTVVFEILFLRTCNSFMYQYIRFNDCILFSSTHIVNNVQKVNYMLLPLSTRAKFRNFINQTCINSLIAKPLYTIPIMSTVVQTVNLRNFHTVWMNAEKNNRMCNLELFNTECLEALSVDNGWARLVVFLFADPHLLECR